MQLIKINVPELFLGVFRKGYFEPGSFYTSHESNTPKSAIIYRLQSDGAAKTN